MISVTCAVLKDHERSAFFTAVRKKAGGKLDRAARAAGVSLQLATEWAKGDKHVPYETLQKISHEFGVDMPAVAELRREMQEVPEEKIRRPRKPAPAASRPSDRPQRAGRPPAPMKPGTAAPPPRQTGRPPAPMEPGRTGHPPRQTGRRKKKAKKSAPAKKVAAPGKNAPGPRAPQLSEEAAYWTGTVLAAGRREADAIVLAAGARPGPNFADVWASRTKALFGVKPAVTASESGRERTARLPVAGFEAFIDRTDIKEGADAPGAPRWTWSNPAWKTGFLKGLVDASAEFHRTPVLRLFGLSDALRRSALKLLHAHGYEAKEADGLVSIEGEDAVRKYAAEIGTENLKLRDQFKARFSHGGQEKTGASRRRRRRR